MEIKNIIQASLNNALDFIGDCNVIAEIDGGRIKTEGKYISVNPLHFGEKVNKWIFRHEVTLPNISFALYEVEGKIKALCEFNGQGREYIRLKNDISREVQAVAPFCKIAKFGDIPNFEVVRMFYASGK